MSKKSLYVCVKISYVYIKETMEVINFLTLFKIFQHMGFNDLNMSRRKMSTCHSILDVHYRSYSFPLFTLLLFQSTLNTEDVEKIFFGTFIFFIILLFERIH